jgi:CBS domain containing-hemolysin-like protein
MRYDDAATWIGLALSFLAGFGFSLFHIALSGLSKIALSRHLEDKGFKNRPKLLARYEEIKIAVDVWRVLFVLIFFIYIVIGCPGLRFRPLGLLAAALAGYAVVFDALPRLLDGLFREHVLAIFLPAYRLILILSFPVLLLFHWLVRREETEEAEEEGREASDEEIDTFIDEAKEEGIIEKGEGELLRSVVEFGDTIVREIMTPRVDMICLRRDATLQKLRNLIIAEKYSRIPVYKDRIDNVDGIAMAKDLLPYGERAHDGDPIEPLIRPAEFVPESMMVSDLLKLFKRVKQKMAIVVDEHGGVTGLVTMEDVMEEIVGEIQDEYDAEEAQIVQNGPGDYTIHGEAKVEELEDLFDVELADDDYITASGLVTHALGRLPQRNETAVVRGLTFEVLDVDPKRIKKLRVRRAPGAPAENPKA